MIAVAFLELHAPSRIVIHHVSKPRYVLTVTMAAHRAGTEITWSQEFEDAAVAARIRHIVEPANEQNLDRLVSILAGERDSSTSRRSSVTKLILIFPAHGGRIHRYAEA